MAGLHFIRISCFVQEFNKEFHVVHAFHKPYGFMKCHLSHPPGIQRGMVSIYIYTANMLPMGFGLFFVISPFTKVIEDIEEFRPPKKTLCDRAANLWF